LVARCSLSRRSVATMKFIQSQCLKLGLNVLDGVAGLDLEGNSLPGQGLEEDQHTTSPRS